MGPEGRRLIYLWCSSIGCLTVLAVMLAGQVSGSAVIVIYWVMIGGLAAAYVSLKFRLVPISTVERVVYVFAAAFWMTVMAAGLFGAASPLAAWLSLAPTVMMGLALQIVMAYLWFSTSTALWQALALPVVSSVIGGVYFVMNSGASGEYLVDFIRFEISLAIMVGFVHILARSKDMLVAARVEATKMRDLAFRDALTGLPNRRYAVEELTRRASGSIRSTVMILDVDDFKKVNDSFGHLVGDAVLERLADLLQQKAPDWLVTRWGGEEFLVIVDGSRDKGIAAAENLRAAVENGRFPEGIRITASIGLSFIGGDDAQHHATAARVAPAAMVTESLRLADRELYRAKDDGRNLVRTPGSGDELQPA